MAIAPVFHPARSKYLVFTADYLIPLAICLGVLVLGYFALYSPFFKVSSLTCSLDFQVCENPALLAELDKLIGQNIFTLNSAQVSARLTSGDFTIREAVLTRQLPGKVKAELQSVYPVVALQIKADPTWVVMDSRFRVIATRNIDPNVPTVVVPGPLTLVLGKPPSDESITQTLRLAIRLADELVSLTSITLLDEDTIQLTLSNGKLAILTPKKKELEQIRALQAVLGNDTILKDTRTIDVRFARPVLR